MQPAGRVQLERAQQDGRWEAAYEPQSRAMVPEDLQRALDEHPDAQAFFATLSGANRCRPAVDGTRRSQESCFLDVWEPEQD